MKRVDENLAAVAQSSMVSAQELGLAGRDGAGRERIAFFLDSEDGPVLHHEQEGAGQIKPRAEATNSSELDEVVTMAMTPRRWDFVARRIIRGIAFYAGVICRPGENSSRLDRHHLLALLDCFSMNCDGVLRDFADGLQRKADGGGEGRPWGHEERVLERLASFSHRVNNCALLDTDGFVLHAVGQVGVGEEQAARLALLLGRVDRKVRGVEGTGVKSLVLSEAGSALLIGRIESKPLALAVTVTGEGAEGVAGLLYRYAAGAIGGGVEEGGTAGRRVWIKDSWLGARRLRACGRFVAGEGATVFHDPACAALLHCDVESLTWYDCRSAPVRAGLRPCRLCHP